MKDLSCIVCDLDGSLLNEESRISGEDLKTIRELKSRGIFVFLATGRHIAFVKDVAAQVGFDLPVCACNGGHIYDYSESKSLFVRSLPNDLSRKVFDYLNENRLHYLIYTPERVIFNEKGPRYAHWQKQNESFAPENRFTSHFVPDEGFDITKETVIKFLVHHPDNHNLESEFNEQFNQNYELSVSRSGKDLMDINAPGVDKGEGVRVLSEIYGFSLESTLALGDNGNDEAMLKMAGIPVAPMNAEENIKSIARLVTSANTDSPLTKAVRTLFPAL